MSQLLSVVVPMYNEAAVLTRFDAAVSEQMQATGHPYEIIFVDDGSTDRTGEVLEALSRDDRVRILRNAQSRGLPAALNRAAAEASGALLARVARVSSASSRVSPVRSIRPSWLQNSATSPARTQPAGLHARSGARG